MPASWEDDAPKTVHPYDPDSGPVNRLELPDAGSNWPTRLAGYWKVLLAALSTIGVPGVLSWLHDAGAVNMPGWVTAGITALVTIVLLLFGPKNKS